MRRNCFYLVVLIAFISGFPHANGDVISIEYFDNLLCDDSNDLYGMQIENFQCFRQVGAQGNGSAMVSCTSGSLVVYEYDGSLDCSTGSSSEVVLAHSFGADTCITSSFAPNLYFASFDGDSVLINCAAEVDWFTAEDGRYELSRQTTSLEAASALDYNRDSCVENSLTTDMEYCYINRDFPTCLPTNADTNNDTFCSANALTTYAYSSSCLYDNANSQYVQYWSDNSKAGYLNMNCGGDWDDQVSDVMPYSDCLGCNRFKDLKDDDDLSAYITGILIAVAIGAAICCGLCCLGVFVCVYGTAALTGLCFRKNKNNGVVTQSADQSHSIVTPIHQQQQQMVYAQPAPPGPMPALELIRVQVPPDACAGMMMMVVKSTGQQVQVVIPEGVLPGQVIEVKV